MGIVNVADKRRWNVAIVPGGDGICDKPKPPSDESLGLGGAPRLGDRVKGRGRCIRGDVDGDDLSERPFDSDKGNVPSAARRGTAEEVPASVSIS